MIRTARATEEELGADAPASVCKWAACSLANSERDVHQVVAEQKLALRVPLTDITLCGRKFPFIRSVSWLNFLVNDMSQWHRLAGLEKRNPGRTAEIWRAFWQRAKTLEPRIDLFGMLDEEQLAHTAACYLHLDEGRTLKRAGIMIISFHSVLGFGFKSQCQDSGRSKKRKRDDGGADEPVSFNVNYTGATLTNRFLLAVVPKLYYDEKPRLFSKLLKRIAKEFALILRHGVRDSDGDIHRVALLGVKGDWPALGKAASLLRTFNHGPKRGSSRAENKGICHLCEAGCQSVPFEQIGCREPAWKATLFASLPWADTPEMLRFLPHDRARAPAYFHIDPWHTIHLGVAKSFMASSIVLALQLFHDGSVEKNLASLTHHYKAWCKSRKLSPFLTKISRDTINWKTFRDEPEGCWNKGNLTSLLCRWFEELCQEKAGEIEAGSMLEKAGQAVVHLNAFVRMLYRSEVFVERARGLRIADRGMQFQRLYRQLASQAFAGNRCLYPLKPKIHGLDHIIHGMISQVENHGFCWNPMIVGNQQEEDFIGRPSRLSRRVSARLPATRTLQRYLIAARAAWVKAGMMR